MENNIFKNIEVMIIASDESKFIMGLFGGFSLTFLAIPVSTEPTILEYLSLFISSLSSMLLIASAFFTSIASGIMKTKKSEAIKDINNMHQQDFMGIFSITGLGVTLFFINIILLSFRVNTVAGIGAATGLILIYLGFKSASHAAKKA